MVSLGGACRPAVVRGDPNAEWTLLVYMASDDDLEQAAIANVREMVQVGSTQAVNVIVQIDRAAATKNGRGFTRGPLLNLPDFTSTKRLRIDRGEVREIADLGETNTGDPAALADFVAWGMTTFPAKKTALVLWDHGGATRGFGWDTTNADQPLSIVDMHAGLAKGLAAAGRARLDVLGFDACLMSNLGVLHELSGLADVVIGSEEVEPAHGWTYAPLITAMSENESPSGLAKRIVESYESACREAKTIDMCTLAAFDTRKLEAILPSLDALGTRLREQTKTPTDWYKLARARVAAEEYGTDAGSPSAYSTVDLADFTTGAARATKQPDPIAPLIEAATIAAFHGAGKPRSHGVSVTFPRQRKDVRPVDNTLAITHRAGWPAFVESYMAFADADRAAPSIQGLDAKVSEGAVDLSATIATDDIAETVALVGTADAKGATSILSLAVLPEGVTSYRWTRTLPTLSDGAASLPVTVFAHAPYLDESGDLVSVVTLAGFLEPHGVAADHIDVTVYMKLSPHAPAAIVGIYRFADGGRAGEIELHPDDRFAPMVKTIGTDGAHSWVASDKTVALGDRAKIRLEERAAAAGEYVVGFRVTDFAANRQIATTRVQLTATR
jgi:hypothetical protein